MAQNDFNQMLRDHISKVLINLSWRCTDCPQCRVCEEQDSGGESRYCWPMVEAAILGNTEWYTAHNQPLKSDDQQKDAGAA